MQGGREGGREREGERGGQGERGAGIEGGREGEGGRERGAERADGEGWVLGGPVTTAVSEVLKVTVSCAGNPGQFQNGCLLPPL